MEILSLGDELLSITFIKESLIFQEIVFIGDLQSSVT